MTAQNTDDQSRDTQGLHRRFDQLETSFKEVRDEQHLMARSLDGVNHRIDMIELTVDAAQKRETMVVNSINEKLTENSNLTKKLFDKFDRHDAQEAKDRQERAQKELDQRDKAAAESKKLTWWLISTCVTVLTSIGMLMFSKVFGV